LERSTSVVFDCTENRDRTETESPPPPPRTYNWHLPYIPEQYPKPFAFGQPVDGQVIPVAIDEEEVAGWWTEYFAQQKEQDAEAAEAALTSLDEPVFFPHLSVRPIDQKRVRKQREVHNVSSF
jgi:hypothetical protein